MGYKKNYTPYFDLSRDKFENYTKRLNDNLEEALYSNTSDMWYGNALSGWSQESVEKGVYDLATNPVELVDLGDGIPRYKVRIEIITSIFDSSLASPTSNLPTLRDPVTEEELALRISRYPYAYTETTNQKPIIGSKLLLEDVGGTYFVKKVIAPDKDFLNLIGGSLSTRHLFNEGLVTPETNVIVDKGTDSTIKDFIAKIKASPHFKDWTPESLAGLVSNSASETGSTFKATIGGDPPSYWLKQRDKYGPDSANPNPEEYNKATARYNKVVLRAVKGYGLSSGIKLYCSWGYWQLQLCTLDGAGSQLAKELGIDPGTEEGKQKWANEIKKDEVQFAFVSKKIKKLGFHNLKDPELAGTNICLKFEKPANKKEKCPKRGAYAKKIFDKHFK